MRHYFEFDGMKSSDFGVFLSGTQTMGAAGRDVDEIVVPGRNGNLTIDNGRFNAISHVYPAFIAETAQPNLMGLRNALLSRRGSKRLSDTIHPDEFYRAYYEHGLEPEVTANLRHSEFEIEFTRDPRRFLVAGDTPTSIVQTSETETGSEITFDYPKKVTAAQVAIAPAQDFSGWTGADVTVNGTTHTVTWTDAGTVYAGVLDVLAGKLTVTHAIIDLGTLDWSLSVPERSVFRTGVTGRKYSTTEIGFCSGYTFYGNASLTVMQNNLPDMEFGFQTTTRFICVRDTRYTDAESFKAAVSGVMLVYPVTSPSEYDLTPLSITTVAGQNSISADCGEMTVTLTMPATLNNPTLFASSPKIRVHGQGTLYIGNTAITVGGSFPYVDIDTEIADCSYEGQNANQYVTFSGLDFPKLEPGENYITFTGFTAVEVTPRWWRL